MGELIIVGAGGHGKVVADAALAAGFHLLGFVDDAVSDAPIPGIKVLGPVCELPKLLDRFTAARIVVAVGDNATRKRIVEDILRGRGQGSPQLARLAVQPRARVDTPTAERPDVQFATIIHPAAVVSPYAEIHEGTVIMAGVVLNPGARIGAHTILNTACSVDHDCDVDDFAHLSPGVHLAGGVTVGEGVHLGTGVSVIPGCHVGAWSIVGAGAAVVRDIPPDVVAYGVPARVMAANG